MMRAGHLRAAALTALAALSTGCSEPGPRGTGVYMLLDTSGTYRHELEKAQQIINYTLSRLEPLDSFAVARIDTGSFSEKDIVARVTLEERPSTANRQRRLLSQQVSDFVTTVAPSRYTDISGGLIQAVEYLNEKNTGQKTILVFSDMEEDLDEGYVRDFAIDFRGCEVVALNVTKLRSDNVDPREYAARLQRWQERVEDGGGSWRVINDLERLERIL